MTTARGFPERFIFRAGMMPSCLLIARTWSLVAMWLREESERSYVAVESRCGCWEAIIYVSGLLGSLALLLSAAGERTKSNCWVICTQLRMLTVLEERTGEGDNWNVHVVCASSFYILTTYESSGFTLRLKLTTVVPSVLRLFSQLSASITFGKRSVPSGVSLRWFCELCVRFRPSWERSHSLSRRFARCCCCCYWADRWRMYTCLLPL